LGKAWIAVSLRIYYTQKEVMGCVSVETIKFLKKELKKKKYGVGGWSLYLRPRFQAFIIFM
jgi:hypothetical protein